MVVPTETSVKTGQLDSAFRLPADWESQAAIWLAWPHNRETWPGRFDPVPAFFASWARLIAEDTPVRMSSGWRSRSVGGKSVWYDAV